MILSLRLDEFKSAHKWIQVWIWQFKFAVKRFKFVFEVTATLEWGCQWFGRVPRLNLHFTCGDMRVALQTVLRSSPRYIGWFPYIAEMISDTIQRPACSGREVTSRSQFNSPSSAETHSRKRGQAVKALISTRYYSWDYIAPWALTCIANSLYRKSINEGFANGFDYSRW
jgi:hypothetical protein